MAITSTKRGKKLQEVLQLLLLIVMEILTPYQNKQTINSKNKSVIGAKKVKNQESQVRQTRS